MHEKGTVKRFERRYGLCSQGRILGGGDEKGRGQGKDGAKRVWPG